jgi:6-phosphofructokinase
MKQIKNNYETNGYAVVVVAEVCEYQDIVDYLEEELDVDIKTINPGFVIRDTKPCAYDTILSVKVAKEAFETAQKFENFIQGGDAKMKLEDYLDIV